MSQPSAMHQWARYYAGLGWAIFPLVPGTKSPFKGTRGSSEATCDLEQIDRWWTANPDANIGLKPSASGEGLFVYDVDPRNGGDASHAALIADHGAMPVTPRVNSPGGDGDGFHLYFSAPPGRRYKGSPGTGIDGKYNAYVALPPNLHPNGKRYEWADGVLPHQLTPADIPTWLIQPEREAPARRTDMTGSLDDVERIRQALSRRDPDDYHHWTEAMASVKHWEDVTEGAQGIGFELIREWSALSAKHDDGALADKWETWDSFKPGARTLGALLHDAGMTAAQGLQHAATVFAQQPVEVQALAWTTQPVERFKGTTVPDEILADLLQADAFDFGVKWAAGDASKLVEPVTWAAGGSCQTSLDVLLLNPRIQDSHELRGMITHVCMNRTTWKTVGKLTDAQKAIAAAGLMAEVEVDDGKLVSAQRACMAAMPVMPGLFQRDHRLCRVSDDGRVLDHTRHTLAGVLEYHLRFQKGGKGTPTRCPDFVASRIMDLQEFKGVPELKAAVKLPVVREDGTVIAGEGLDESTGLYCLESTGRPLKVLDNDELQAAIGRVWAPFAEFPFTGPADVAAFWAALLTTACRPALQTAPAFLISAQAPGTGKTKLGECLMLLAGASTASISLPSDPAEQGKVVTSVLLSGPAGVLLDNLMGVIRPQASFCSALTSDVYQGRILGRSEIVGIPNRALWVLTGNNVGLSGDLVRRVLTINLSSVENPEYIQHSFDPVEVIRRSSRDRRADLLDIFATFKAAGMPTRVRGGFASFEPWNKLVRQCVAWLGKGDPLETQQQAQAEDEEVLTHRLMLNAWYDRFGSEPKALHTVGINPFETETAEHWQEAYTRICEWDGRLNARKLGNWLRKVKGRRLDGMRFEGSQTPRGRVEWRVVKD